MVRLNEYNLTCIESCIQHSHCMSHNSSFLCNHLTAVIWFVLSEPKNGDNYTYTSGIDAEDTFLFCNTEDSSVQLSNIYWRRQNRIGSYSNPLDVYSLRNTLIHTNSHDMQCFDVESGINIRSIGLFIQGWFLNYS